MLFFYLSVLYGENGSGKDLKCWYCQTCLTTFRIFFHSILAGAHSAGRHNDLPVSGPGVTMLCGGSYDSDAAVTTDKGEWIGKEYEEGVSP